MEETTEVLEILTSMILKHLQLMKAEEAKENDCNN